MQEVNGQEVEKIEKLKKEFRVSGSCCVGGWFCGGRKKGREGLLIWR
jgi:hypothetical protein